MSSKLYSVYIKFNVVENILFMILIIIVEKGRLLR